MTDRGETSLRRIGGPSFTIFRVVFEGFSEIMAECPRNDLIHVELDLYEASVIDGVNGLRQFWRITLPPVSRFIMLTSTLVLVRVVPLSVMPLLVPLILAVISLMVKNLMAKRYSWREEEEKIGEEILSPRNIWALA